MISLPRPFSDQVFQEVVTAAILVIVVALVARIATLFLDRIVLRLAGRTRTHLDDRIISAVRTPVFVLIVLLGVRAGLAQLTFLSETWIHTLEGLLFIGFVFMGCVLLYRLVGEIVASFTKNLTVDGGIDTQLVIFVRRVIQLVLVSIAVIMVLDHFGLDISAMVAPLGEYPGRSCRTTQGKAVSARRARSRRSLPGVSCPEAQANDVIAAR